MEAWAAAYFKFKGEAPSRKKKAQRKRAAEHLGDFRSLLG